MHFHLQIENKKGWEFNQTRIPNKPSENKTKLWKKNIEEGIIILHNYIFWNFQPPTSLVATKSNLEATK
jgi:hypothetical protein